MRGQIIERWRALNLTGFFNNLGPRLPKNFLTFDFYNPLNRIATSLKSLDPRGYSLDGVFQQLNEYIGEAIEFPGYRLDSFELAPEMISSKVLEVWMPLREVSPELIGKLAQAVDIAALNNITLRIYFL